MKGPGLRLDLDVRRVWRCATCQTERHTPGSVTLVVCHFCQDHPLMTLIEHRRSDRGPVAPPDMLIDLHPDDVDAPAFVPAHLREPVECDDAATVVEQESTTDPLDTSTIAIVAEASTEAEADEAPATDAEPTPPRTPHKKSRRKNNRRKKNHSRQEASQEHGKASLSQRSPTGPPQSETPPASPDDSFGAGLTSP